MREIEFRAKTIPDDTNTSEPYWITGLFLEDGGQYLMNDMYIEIDPETIGQFIGVLDDTKTKIYEMDIIEWDSHGMKQRAVVEYRDGCFYPFNGHDCGCCSNETSWLLDRKFHSIRIIGNLIDNPELKP